MYFKNNKVYLIYTSNINVINTPLKLFHSSLRANLKRMFRAIKVIFILRIVKKYQDTFRGVSKTVYRCILRR